MNDFDRNSITCQAHAIWNTDPQLRAEFGDNRDAYTAYAIADAQGLARVFNTGPVVSGADVARQQRIQQQAAEHGRLTRQQQAAEHSQLTRQARGAR